jgi:succinate-acetate transporter protein
MFLGMGENLLKALEIMPQNTMAVDGWIFLIMGILMCGFTIGHLPGPFAPLLFMVATDLFFVPAGLYFLTGAEFLWMIAGWDLPLVVISIIWVVLGTILNPIFGRNVVPLGPPLLRLSGGERPVATGDAE